MFTNIRDRNRLPISEVPASSSFSPSFSFQRVPCAQERDNGTGPASVGHISQALHFLASSILLTSQGEWGRLICSCLTLNVIYTGRAGCVNFHCEPDPPDQIIQSHLHRKKGGGGEKKNRNPKAPYAENSNEEAFCGRKSSIYIQSSSLFKCMLTKDHTSVLLLAGCECYVNIFFNIYINIYFLFFFS